ncbi:hypothetical protein B0189_08925 [Moraxella cuniculi]|nr:hypothetical protein B0189_08925 [Moraxella cuniculi]
MIDCMAVVVLVVWLGRLGMGLGLILYQVQQSMETKERLNQEQIATGVLVMLIKLSWREGDILTVKLVLMCTSREIGL